MAQLIDTMHLGRDRVIGAWRAGEVIVDPGPSTGLGALLAGLGGFEPRALLLTHIHLDHAGAAGSLVRRFPSLRVFVHEVGAPHLADPSRLWASAARLYGEAEMARLWGEVAPVPEGNLVPLRGGERVEGMKVLWTPGHASHHVCFLDSAGAAYVGDVAGVRIPPSDLTLMPTPPPEIDVEAWLDSLGAIAQRAPKRLRLAHFGEVDDAAAQLEAAAASLRRITARARELDRGAFLAELEAEIDDQPEAAAERMRQALPPDQVWLGLERYWRRRA